MLKGKFPKKETREHIAWIITITTFLLTFLKDWESIVEGGRRFLTEPNWSGLFLPIIIWLGKLLLTIDILIVLFAVLFLLSLPLIMIIIGISGGFKEDSDDNFETILTIDLVILGVGCSILGVFYIFPDLNQSPSSPSFLFGYIFSIPAGLAFALHLKELNS